MALLSIANVAHSFEDRPIFDGVNLTLNEGEHIGLVGVNGCGKSTLLKMVAGVGDLGKPLEGQIQVTKGCTVGYLHQDHKFDPEKTLFEETLGAFAHIEESYDRLGEIAELLATANDEEMAKLLAEYEQVESIIAANDGGSYEHKAHQVLAGLGIPISAHDVKCKDLSGGQRARVALAQLLITSPDILLLDEPTNHLDIAGRQWLEDFLVNYKGAVILISHDRWLLDRCVSKIYEMERGKLVEYPGNYTKFRELRVMRLNDLKRIYDKQQEKIKSEQAFIDKFRAGQRASQAAGREKRLVRFKDEETFELPPELNTMKLQLLPKKRSGDQVIQAENISVAYEGRTLFQDFSISVKRGDRIGILGPNGAGKSTIVRVLIGEQHPSTGTTRLGSQVDVGWFRQSHDHLPPETNLVEYIRQHTVSQTDQEARDIAGAFLFSGDDQKKMIKLLSGGERARVMMATLMTEGHNLMVLDEPTNHLDIPSAERLEEALRGYTQSKVAYSDAGKTGGEGTLILITHDRMLLDNLVNQLIVFDGEGGVKLFLGNYSDYMAATGNKLVLDGDEAAKDKKKKLPPPAKKTAPGPSLPPPPPSPMVHKPSLSPNRPTGQSPGKKNKAMGGMPLERLEARITELEAQKSAIEAQMANPETYKNQTKFTALLAEQEKVADELAGLNEEWSGR